MPSACAPYGVIVTLASFKLLQFVDRNVINGSPLEFGAFVHRTMGGAENEATLFGALSSVYTVGTVAGCLSAPALLLRFTQSRLLAVAMLTWLLGVGCSSVAFWLPLVPSTYWSFCLARVLVGMGAGIITVTWPPYLEAVIPAGQRSMAMALVETGTALGAALGKRSLRHGSNPETFAALHFALVPPLRRDPS
jgi:MFS family permease